MFIETNSIILGKEPTPKVWYPTLKPWRILGLGTVPFCTVWELTSSVSSARESRPCCAWTVNSEPRWWRRDLCSRCLRAPPGSWQSADCSQLPACLCAHSPWFCLSAKQYCELRSVANGQNVSCCLMARTILQDLNFNWEWINLIFWFKTLVKVTLLVWQMKELKNKRSELKS